MSGAIDARINSAHHRQAPVGIRARRQAALPISRSGVNNAVMQEWRRWKVNALKTAGALAAHRPLWADFAAYCDLRGRGLRREAFQHLDRFILTIGDAGFEERRRFVCWLAPRSDFAGDDGLDLRPEPLRRLVVLPTLLEWIERAPGDPQPFVWLGSENDLRQALMISPGHPEAAIRLASLLLNHAEFAMHELPWGLIGKSEEVLSWVVEAEGLLRHAPEGPAAAALRRAQVEFEGMMRNYCDYLKSAERQMGANFRDWTVAGERPSRISGELLPWWRCAR